MEAVPCFSAEVRLARALRRISTRAVCQDAREPHFTDDCLWPLCVGAGAEMSRMSRAAGQRGGAQRGAGTRLVVDGDGLAQALRQPLAEHARHGVDPAARRVGGDQRDRLGRVGLGAGERASGLSSVPVAAAPTRTASWRLRARRERSNMVRVPGAAGSAPVRLGCEGQLLRLRWHRLPPASVAPPRR